MEELYNFKCQDHFERVLNIDHEIPVAKTPETQSSKQEDIQDTGKLVFKITRVNRKTNKEVVLTKS